MTEQLRQVEALSEGDTGKLAYETSERLATQIGQLPEFREALVREFFHRSRRGSSDGVQGVVFDKGDYTYRVDFSSDSEYYTNESSSFRMTLRKWDKAERESQQPKGPLARLEFYSWFREEEDQKDYGGGDISLNLDVNRDHEATGQEAVDSIGTHFGDLLPQPISF